MTHDQHAAFAALLRSAFEEPGTTSAAALQLPRVVVARGYIQSWWGAGNPIPERSAQRILKAADQILKAGADAPSAGDEDRS